MNGVTIEVTVLTLWLFEMPIKWQYYRCWRRSGWEQIKLFGAVEWEVRWMPQVSQMINSGKLREVRWLLEVSHVDRRGACGNWEDIETIRWAWSQSIQMFNFRWSDVIRPGGRVCPQMMIIIFVHLNCIWSVCWYIYHFIHRRLCMNTLPRSTRKHNTFHMYRVAYLGGIEPYEHSAKIYSEA